MAGFVVVLIGIAVVTTLFLTSVVGSRTSWTTAFQELAQRYGGWYSPAGLTRRPAANFSYKEATCQLRCRLRRRTGGGPETELRIQWPVRRMKMEIIRNHGSPRIRYFRNSQTIGIGDASFDRDFNLYATDPSLARDMMTSGVRWQIEQLGQFLGTDSVYIGIDKGWLSIAKRGFIKQSLTLDDFVRFALELYDQMMLVLSVGIDFRDDDLVSAIEDVQCPVCSCDVEGQMVICVRCKTPHCLDCWMYNGQCGMFACGETRYSTIGSPSAEH